MSRLPLRSANEEIARAKKPLPDRPWAGRRPRAYLRRFVPVFLCLVFLVTVAGKKNPETASSQQTFGVEMAKRGLWSEALFRFRQVERMKPDNARNLNNLAVAYEALGQFEKALDYYQRAIRLEPGNADLKKNYSRFVEFYRSFKPKESEGDDAGSGDRP